MNKIFTYEEARKVFDSPALIRRANGYPSQYKGRVPLFVKMSRTVTSDLPLVVMEDGDEKIAIGENEYPVWVNSYGAVAIVYSNGSTLGVKPDEFTVTKFHP